jgi:hypothetical protein
MRLAISAQKSAERFAEARTNGGSLSLFYMRVLTVIIVVLGACYLVSRHQHLTRATVGLNDGRRFENAQLDRSLFSGCDPGHGFFRDDLRHSCCFNRLHEL